MTYECHFLVSLYTYCIQYSDFTGGVDHKVVGVDVSEVQRELVFIVDMYLPVLTALVTTTTISSASTIVTLPEVYLQSCRR